jgi:CheY-like chemotaxis protein
MIESDLLDKGDERTATCDQKLEDPIRSLPPMLSLADFTGLSDWNQEGSLRSRQRVGLSTSESSDNDFVAKIPKRRPCQQDFDPKQDGRSGVCESGSGMPKVQIVNVLCVEDSLVQRKICQKQLGGLLGVEMWNIETCESGEEALQKLTSKTFKADIIVIDEYLDGVGSRMSGHEVVKHIRQMDGYDQTIIIGLTARPDEAREAFEQAGADAVWPKPMPPTYEFHANAYMLLRTKLSFNTKSELNRNKDGDNRSKIIGGEKQGYRNDDTTIIDEESNNILLSDLMIHDKSGFHHIPLSTSTNTTTNHGEI